MRKSDALAPATGSPEIRFARRKSHRGPCLARRSLSPHAGVGAGKRTARERRAARTGGSQPGAWLQRAGRKEGP